MPTTQRPPSTERLVFGKRLRAERHLIGLTLEDLAEAADMNWSYIAQVERGTRNIGIDNMAALARAVGVPLAFLLQSNDEPAKRG
ncbi:helix-turn-helix domain-containing protein [Deinococcus sp. AJ005]|uniref:helix-turn-helix domain-containing protein n=1 Tax=Deinococcus sp. AJ005 TaxID=2652443 RepID=UPI00125CC920|nr:helix-turn-helix transcriptional regulator [Deinococcus sp. AJ005]QFP76281.1 helix-turn-helix transcriptional regulator [Deinococcus sp. AJ005]